MIKLTANRNLLGVSLLAVAVSLGFSSTESTSIDDVSANTEIETVLRDYERALNASDLDGVLKLYTEDGVFMAPHRPSAVGIKQVEATYTGAFQAIDLEVEFDIVEIEVMADDWAFARTNSSGTTTINATGDKVAEANQELFVLRKIGDNWQIARYSFSSTNPPR